jgi:hypothetical protein
MSVNLLFGTVPQMNVSLLCSHSSYVADDKLPGVTVARLYCNLATQEAFSYAFEALFTSVEKATGHKVKLKVFDTSGNLLAIILDMEAAQVQGLGDAMV